MIDKDEHLRGNLRGEPRGPPGCRLPDGSLHPGNTLKCHRGGRALTHRWHCPSLGTYPPVNGRAMLRHVLPLTLVLTVTPAWPGWAQGSSQGASPPSSPTQALSPEERERRHHETVKAWERYLDSRLDDISEFGRMIERAIQRERGHRRSPSEALLCGITGSIGCPLWRMPSPPPRTPLSLPQGLPTG